MHEPVHIPCPDCDGTGRSRGISLVHMANGRCEPMRMPCRTCNGWGDVPADYPERLAAAEALRRDRIGRDMSLREEAKRLGISAHELSDREHVRDSRPMRGDEDE